MANTAGGAFNPHADIDFTGTVTISGTLAVTGSGVWNVLSATNVTVASN